MPPTAPGSGWVRRLQAPARCHKLGSRGSGMSDPPSAPTCAGLSAVATPQQSAAGRGRAASLGLSDPAPSPTLTR
eukprot:7619906-Alexandrium_andersonii.AAC.1